MLFLNSISFPCVQSGHTALIIASLRGYMEIVRLLLQEGANVSLCNKVCTTNIKQSVVYFYTKSFCE